MRLGGPAIFGIAVGIASAAGAQPVPPGEEGELLAFLPPRHGEHACFARAYDSAHLAAHPDQTVTAMEFRIAYFRWESDDLYPLGQRNYYFALRAKRRGEASELTAMGECTPLGEGIGCGVDCDGGGIRVSRDVDGTVLVDLGEDGRIRMTPGCGDEETGAIDLTSGKDDRWFRLDPVPGAQCQGYDDW